MIPPRKVYFGTRTRMAWINAPAINVGRGRGTWTEGGTLLNGGGYVLRSNYSHVQYTMNWPMSPPDEVRQITDYYDNVYGEGPFYFLDPFVIGRNLLPMNWAVPHLASDDAPGLILDVKPVRSTTGANTLDLPPYAAMYTLTAGSVPASLYIPVPAGEQFEIGVVGEATGTARLTVTPNTGTPVQPTLRPLNSTSIINTTMSNVGGGVTLTLTGLGTIKLYGMAARIASVSKGGTGFESGQGNSGLDFSDAPIVTGLSSAIREGLQSVSATLVEVGAWAP